MESAPMMFRSCSKTFRDAGWTDGHRRSITLRFEESSMAVSGIGHFVLIIEDRNGRVMSEVEGVCRSGRPAERERVRLLGAVYVVTKVELQEAETATKKPQTDRRYFEPLVYIRPLGSRTAPAGDDSEKAKGQGKHSLFPTTHEGSRQVLPFRPPVEGRSAALASEVLPVGLVANLVMVGYRLQADDWDNDRALAAELLRTPAGDDLRPDLPSRFELLSRTAKQNLVACALFFGEGAGAQAAPGPIEGRADPGRRPRLALVRDGDDWSARRPRVA
jgi:hypothetical protein